MRSDSQKVFDALWRQRISRIHIGPPPRTEKKEDEKEIIDYKSLLNRLDSMCHDEREAVKELLSKVSVDESCRDYLMKRLNRSMSSEEREVVQPQIQHKVDCVEIVDHFDKGPNPVDAHIITTIGRDGSINTDF